MNTTLKEALDRVDAQYDAEIDKLNGRDAPLDDYGTAGRTRDEAIARAASDHYKRRGRNTGIDDILSTED